MSEIPVTRAAHLFPFIDILYDIGVPVERELLRAKLPILIEEMPNAYISENLALDFASKCARLEDLKDFGWMAAKHLYISQLSPTFLHGISQGQTLHQRLGQFISLMWLENPLLSGGVHRINGETQITCNLGGNVPDNRLQLSEWIQVMSLITIVRQGASSDWTPIEISFQSDFQPCDDALEHFGNTRMVFGQRETSITVPSALLAIPAQSPAKPIVSSKVHSRPSDHIRPSLAGSLRAAIEPYLADRYPSIELAAEIAGTSKRSLQRKLKKVGMSYSDIVEGARFEIAERALSQTDNRIIDIGFSCGYDDPSHFARAFRRISGMSPREYRVSCAV